MIDLKDGEVLVNYEEQGKAIINLNNLDLEKLHLIYKNEIYIEDTKRIDVVLAAALSKKMEGIPLWLIIIGASGDMKSVQLNAIRNDDVYILHNLTSKTLVNGYKDKKEHPDLAPKLNNKIVIIPDMAQILKLPPVEKAELWGQLRDLYDGFAGKESGQGSSAKYENLKITLLAGSTPSIDAQILVHQDLGTRELIYRTKGNKNQDKVMKKCFENEETEKEVTERLRIATKNFLEKTNIKRDYIKPELLEKIMVISKYISKMRANAEFDNYTNELRNFVYPEEPTRIAKQLKRMYICLMSLSDDYPEERALEILWEIARGSAFPIRVKLMDFFKDKTEGEYSTSQLAEIMQLGKSTIKRECSVLEHLGFITCRREPTTYPDRFYEYWKPSKLIIDTICNNKSNIYTNIISMDSLDKKTGGEKLENLSGRTSSQTNNSDNEKPKCEVIKI